jgi:hypothetical protein
MAEGEPLSAPNVTHISNRHRRRRFPRPDTAGWRPLSDRQELGRGAPCVEKCCAPTFSIPSIITPRNAGQWILGGTKKKYLNRDRGVERLGRPNPGCRGSRVGAGEKRQIMRDCCSGDQRVEARAAGLRPDFRRAAATVPNTRAASLSNAIASKSASARCRCLPSPTRGA